MVNNKQYKVHIIEFGSNKAVKETDSTDYHSACKIDDGININLNHDQYYTLIKEAK